MILKYCRKWSVSVLATSLILTAHGIAASESLAGSKGHVRFPIYIAPGSIGGCGQNYRNYIAASGHSAYAMTPFNWSVEYLICGSSLNAASQQAAEAKALQSCQAGLKRYKVATSGLCSIAASK